MKHQYTEWLAEAERYMKSSASSAEQKMPEPPDPLPTWKTMELIEACEAALTQLQRIRTNKGISWAKTPAGDKLRKALGIKQ